MVIDLEYDTYSDPSLLHCDIRAIRHGNYSHILINDLIEYSNEIAPLLGTRLYIKDYLSQIIMLLPYHISLTDVLLEHYEDIIVPDLIYASHRAQPGLSILTDIFPFVRYKLFSSIDEMEKEVLHANGKELGKEGRRDNLSDRIVVYSFRPVAMRLDRVAEQSG